MRAQQGCQDFLLGVLTTQALRQEQERGARLAVRHHEVTHMRNTGATHGFPKGPGELLPGYTGGVSPSLEAGP